VRAGVRPLLAALSASNSSLRTFLFSCPLVRRGVLCFRWEGYSFLLVCYFSRVDGFSPCQNNKTKRNSPHTHPLLPTNAQGVTSHNRPLPLNTSTFQAASKIKHNKNGYITVLRATSVLETITLSPARQPCVFCQIRPTVFRRRLAHLVQGVFRHCACHAPGGFVWGSLPGRCRNRYRCSLRVRELHQSCFPQRSRRRWR